MCVFRARPNREKPSFLNKEGAGGPKLKVIFVESILAQSQTIYFLTLSITLAPWKLHPSRDFHEFFHIYWSF